MVDFSKASTSSDVVQIGLTRATIGESSGLDVTAKSAQGWARKLAPSWSLVMGHKRGSLHDAAYEEEYLKQLAFDLGAVHFPYVQLWHYGLQHGRQICFLCYCRDGAFCHTHLLIDYIISNYHTFYDARTVKP